MSTFGQLLRRCRKRTIDPNTGGPLSQKRLGELLGDELGSPGYSGTAVSDWERDRSQIHKDHRRVLVSLVKILRRYGGIDGLLDAEQLLLAGNYRPLDSGERAEVFPNQTSSGSSNDGAPTGNASFSIHALGRFLYKHAQNWPEKLLETLGSITQRWTGERSLSTFLWIAVWLLAWVLVFPLLFWPFTDRLETLLAALKYAFGSLLIPLLIATLTRTREEGFWQSLRLENSFILRFYTHLGASLGFHVGYFIIMAIALPLHYLQLGGIVRWLSPVGAAWTLALGYASARQVPLNLWKAYGELRFRHGAIFAMSFLLGPAWAAFFYFFFPYLLTPTIGIPILLFSLISFSALLVWGRKRGDPAIPAHIWAAIFGAIWMLDQAARGASLFSLVAFGSLLVALIFYLAQGRVRATFTGGTIFILAVALLLLAFQIDAWVGRAATLIALLVWWWKGRQHLWLPAGFWGIIAATVVASLLLKVQLVGQAPAAAALGLATLGILWVNSHTA